MRTVITWASPGSDGDRTSCRTFIVDFDPESVVFCNLRYPLLWWRNACTPSNSLTAAAGVCVDPVGVASREDRGVFVGREGVVVDHRTEVRRLGVSHDPTSITNGGKACADKVVHPHCFGPSDLRDSVDGTADSRAGHGGGDVVCGYGPEQRVWQSDNVAVCRGIGQA